MPAITLPEYAKGVEDQKVRAIIELFPESVDFMGVIPFMSAPSGSYRYMEEGALPDNVGFRALNEGPSAGYGLMLDKVEKTFPMAGNLDVDRRLIARQGMDAKSRQERMQAKKFASVWAQTTFFGDNQANSREYTGVKPRLKSVGGSTDGSNYRSRILANSASSGGAALSLAQLDRAIDLVENPNAIIMPLAIKGRFPAAQRNTQIGGFINVQADEFGKEQVSYRGIRIYTGYGVGPFGEFLPFNEVAVGGGSAVTTSIYVMRFSEDGVCALEQQPMEVHDYGLLEDGFTHRTNVEHDVGLMICDPFSALRLSSITNAPIAA